MFDLLFKPSLPKKEFTIKVIPPVADKQGKDFSGFGKVLVGKPDDSKFGSETFDVIITADFSGDIRKGGDIMKLPENVDEINCKKGDDGTINKNCNYFFSKNSASFKREHIHVI
ncbi:hypothetical protein LCGC14_2594910 [marine sediment metagenome]|uniref:Uncharacterized protein n=1 Tax=marine sediment metagenome TaxID=412755 RepID=A0A0F9AAS7_9ZZZZ